MVQTEITKDQKRAYKTKLIMFSRASYEEKQRLMREDASLFAYALFRNPNLTKLRLFDYQDLIINDKSKYISVAISRQSGKSTLAIIRALHHIFYHDNSTVLLVSKTKDQSMELITKLRQWINSSPAKEMFEELQTGADNRREFYLKNHDKDTHSRIISVPATDAARGYSADLVIADEIAFWTDATEVFNEALLPTVTYTNGTIMMLSTPKGRIGVFAESFKKENIWSCYQFTWRVCPVHTLESMALKKEQVGEFAFNQEYEASFVDDQAAYFRYKEVNDAIDDTLTLGGVTGHQLVAGVDFGKINDPSVITLAYIDNPKEHPDAHRVRVFDVIEFKLGTPYKDVVKSIQRLYKQHNIRKIFYDQTGVGEGPGEFMHDLGLPIEGIKFSLQSKMNMFSNLKLLFEKRQIHIPRLTKMLDELYAFQYEYTQGDNIKLGHPEGGHDDYVDSLCLAAYGLKRMFGAPVSASFINDGKERSVLPEEIYAPPGELNAQELEIKRSIEMRKRYGYGGYEGW